MVDRQLTGRGTAHDHDLSPIFQVFVAYYIQYILYSMHSLKLTLKITVHHNNYVHNK